ncbi:MAG: VIT1/CCC1 transporter family protein [Thermoplasmata archaeon]
MGYREWKDRIRRYEEITRCGAIVRRYFVIGAFDGALTILGVILGAFFAGGGREQVPLIIAAGLSAAVALAVSSVVGAYEVERIEKTLDRRRVERALLSEVGYEHREAYRFAARISAFAHGVSPLIASMIPIVPLYLITDYFWGTVAASILTLSLLFLMGWYLGRLAKEFAFFTGLRFVLAGLGTAAIILLIGHGF